MKQPLSKKKLKEAISFIESCESKQEVTKYLDAHRYCGTIVDEIIENEDFETFSKIASKFLSYRKIGIIALRFGDKGVDRFPAKYAFYKDKVYGKVVEIKTKEIGFNNDTKQLYLTKGLFADNEPIRGGDKTCYYSSLRDLYNANDRSLKGLMLYQIPQTSEDLSGIDFKGAYVLRENVDDYSNATPVDVVIKKEYKKPYFVVTTEDIADGDVLRIEEKRFLKFHKFAKYLNNDLSGAQLIGCDLSDVNLEEDLSGIDFKGAYVLRDNIDNYSNAIPVDAVIKKEYKKPYFVVTTEYIADGDVIKVDERRFLKFEQFAKYLNNDLSGAQLIGCDLSNVNLELYCLENAVIAYNPNEMIERIQSTSERIEIPESTELTIAHDDRFSVSDFNLFYISDLHLDTKISICCRTDDEIEKYLRKKIRQIQKSISQAEDSRYRSLLIVLGDISCDFELNKLFLQKLRHTCGNLLLILGNHDLWWDDYRKQINRYEEFCSEEGIVFLQNSLCVFKSGLFDNLYGTTYNANFIEDAPAEELKNIIQNSRLIIFGGVGFAGLNNRFNASEGNIYRGAISRKEEIKESKYFEQLYAKIDEALGDKEIIIATHNPMHDWSNKQRNPNWIYLNGHTHHNNYVDNDVAHVFADNQIGYEDKRFILKSVPISGQYDTFENYDDGIYEITKRQYNEFNKGKRIRGHMDFADTVIMIKKNDYYLFMCKNKSSFSILNGGRRTKCSHDPEYCYDHLEELVNIVERPLKDYLEYQSEISNQVRSFGGSGSIHGCIVDIDYFTHIFVNPLDRSLHPYYAEDIYHKIVYPNVAGMLQNHCPSLYPKYEKKYLKGSGQDQEKSMSTLSNQGLVNLDTSIYDASRFFSAAQYLSKSKVLRFWLDENAISFTYLLMDSKQSLPETISDDFADVVDKN